MDLKCNEEMTNFVDMLLPKHINDLMKSDNNALVHNKISINNNALKTGEQYENVTLLFADIAGFTAYSAGRSPAEVVSMLSDLFTEFDRECNASGLYKVYTIGDCYVVMGFSDKNSRDFPEYEAQQVVELSIKFIQIIANVRESSNFDGLHMRIGIHTGNIIGGVIGTDIVRFDIYGQDVSIANTMESEGKNDRIHVSGATKEMLQNIVPCPYSFEYDQKIEMNKFDKKIDSYFLLNAQEVSQVENVQNFYIKTVANFFTKLRES